MTKPRRFTAAEDEVIVRERARGMTILAISRLLARSEVVVTRRIKWLEAHR